MPKCYHCGTEVADTHLCMNCGQYYCVLHTDLITHECNLVIESNLLQTDISNLQVGGIDLFETSELRVPKQFQKAVNYGTKGVQFLDFLQDQGWIELDRLIIENSVSDIIQSQINFGLDKEFVEFIRGNYRGFDLSDVIQRFRHQSIVDDLEIWLGGIANNRSDYNDEILNYPGTFHDLLICHYLHLRDGSYLEEIDGLEPHLGDIVNTKGKIKGTINVSRRLLTYISEHARHSGEKECSGLLMGMRNSSGAINELSGYFPLRIGTKTSAQIKSEDFTKLINHIGGLEKKLVGWYHSHPKFAAAMYSTADKVSHISLSYGYSIFSFLKQYNTKISDEELYNMSMLLGQFTKAQIADLLKLLSKAIPKTGYFYYIRGILNDYLLECYEKHGYDPAPAAQNSRIPLTKDSYLGMLKTIKSDFEVLQHKLRRLNKRFKVGTSAIDFKILSFIGLVICPSLRYIVVMECSKDDDDVGLDSSDYNCFYYRINVI